jgi:Type I phosphodiesterase / nucleotide pyrophosphatase
MIPILNKEFSFPRFGSLRCMAAIFGSAVAGILLAAPAMAGDDDHHKKVDHVLLISVDGLHQSDLAWYVLTHPHSTLAELVAQGVDYSNASTPFPSDSFPGMVGQVTGGNPSSTGIYYDDTWNHAVFPAGPQIASVLRQAERLPISRLSTRTWVLLMQVKASCRLREQILGPTFCT